MASTAAEGDRTESGGTGKAPEEETAGHGRLGSLLDWLADGGLPALTLGVVPTGTGHARGGD